MKDYLLIRNKLKLSLLKSYFLQGTKNDTVGDYGEKSINAGGDGRANDDEVCSWTKEELHIKMASSLLSSAEILHRKQK